jgi:tetratricopeptide (TPR) repeat protein
MRGRAKTDSTGRYQFNGLADGYYTVKVQPFRYDLEDQSQTIEINTMTVRGSGGGNGYYTLDFYLLPKKGGLAESELSVVFAQEVPKEAKKLYDQALKDLSKDRKQDGINGLREALKIFPNYYAALHQLGKELFIKGEYEESAPLLLKAAEVNSKSPSTLFYLGYSLHKLNSNKPALTALNQAHILAPASTQVLLILGKVERLEGKYIEAEKHLTEAKQLSKVNVPDIHWELAQLYGLNLKKYKEAVNELEQYLKAGKFDDDYTKKIKKLISDFQEKAKNQSSKS